MIVVLLFSLGILNSSTLGLATPTSPRDPGPPVRVADRAVRAGWHSPTDPGLPESPTREGLTEADSKEADDELVAFWLVSSSSVLNPALKAQRPFHPAATQRSRGGLFHEPRPSWQFRC